MLYFTISFHFLSNCQQKLQKMFCLLSSKALTTPPLLVAGPLNKYFFAASIINPCKYIFRQPGPTVILQRTTNLLRKMEKNVNILKLKINIRMKRHKINKRGSLIKYAAKVHKISFEIVVFLFNEMKHYIIILSSFFLPPAWLKDCGLLVLCNVCSKHGT